MQQQSEVDRLLYEVESPEEVRQAISKLETSQQLFAFASEYNWDDGVGIPEAISEHPLCDLATALLLFWHSEALECFGPNAEPPEYQETWFDFCTTVTRKLLNGYYSVGPNAFDPDLGRVQRYKLEKKGIPALLLDSIAPSTNQG